MKERPILFSAAMVRAILEGSKTVTRRIVKPRPPEGLRSDGLVVFSSDRKGRGKWAWENLGGCRLLWVRPPCLAGDQLWVRETWQAVDFGPPERIPKERGKWTLVYAADPDWSNTQEERGFPWRPSIHMPRWASRITLDVVSVRPERLWDITDAEIEREGAVARVHHGDFGALPVSGFDGVAHMTRRALWAAGWNGINGKTAPWESNPWVWRIEFKRIHTEGATK